MKRQAGRILFAVAALMLLVTPAWAEIEFFGTAKVKPTYYSNFDFQDGKNDGPIVNEGGITAGEHIRSELRLGWKAKGDKWSIKMIAEADIMMEKDNADRSFYVGAEKEAQPNTGAEFGIERAEFLYAFSPMLELERGGIYGPSISRPAVCCSATIILSSASAASLRNRPVTRRSTWRCRTVIR
ncbi:MAG: hypothetical protein R2864_10835 [Syntrophotaleaceae bacterium]